MSKWKSIGQLLLEYGLTDDEGLREGLKMHKATGMRLGEAMVKLGKVSKDDINWVLSKQLDIPFVIVEDVIPNDELLGKFSRQFLIENRIIPLHETDDQITIVTEDPLNDTAIELIRNSFNKKVNVSTGSGRKIEKVLKKAYEKVTLPELIDSLEGIIERIRETSFYRMDFLPGKTSCRINIFGAGISRNIAVLQGAFTKQDIFGAFDSLNIPFLYDTFTGDNNLLLSVYPVVNRLDVEGMAVISGRYGLCLPPDITFTDTAIHGVAGFFRADNPVQGYGYFATKKGAPASAESVCVIDAAPDDFRECYIDAYIPEKCPSCNGGGCEECNDLGYRFSVMEGVYSSDDLNKRLKEGRDGKD
ncbi:MAG: hypothetical protein GXP46_05525 [Deferribacteres bacterium]|nr:hypothetical protein [Deferribacteres bacterium]